MRWSFVQGAYRLSRPDVDMYEDDRCCISVEVFNRGAQDKCKKNEVEVLVFYCQHLGFRSAG